MRRLSLLLPLILILTQLASAGQRKMVPRFNTITKTWSSYPEVTIRDIQEKPIDSLLALDADQNANNTLWTKQAANFLGDTVVIVAQVIAPYYLLTFTQQGFTMLLHDTTASNEWTGILVRVGSSADTAQARLDGFVNPEKGDIIRITGRIEEFPTANNERMNSTTQFNPTPGVAIEIIDDSKSRPLPEHTLLTVSDFYEGAFPGGDVKYSTGEKYEGSLVELRDVTVTAIVSSSRGTWAMVDAGGNYIADYDASHYFTYGNGTITIPGDPSFSMPPTGAVINYIRGTMLTVAGGENPRGYRICPLEIGDVEYGITLPSITTHRRYPVVVSSTDSVEVQVRVSQISGGYQIASAQLFKSINNGSWVSVPLTMISADSTYSAYILDDEGNPYGDGTYVRYFIQATDTAGNSNILANSSSAVGADTSKGYFFFTVRDGAFTIEDVQYTPFTNGRSGYVGGVVSVSGIVTADTSDIGVSPLNTGGTNSWYIQNGNNPWSGIWVVSRDSATKAQLSAMKRGDSVTVTGSVQEQFDVTRIFDSLVTIHSSGHNVPEPITITSGTFGPGVGNGTLSAEQYEGMLVRVVGAKVSDVYPTFSDPTEYSVSDGSAAVLIRRDGLHTYSNQPTDTLLGYRILVADDVVDTIIGISYFSFSRYKIAPRTNSDFVVGHPYPYRAGWNLISVPRTQLPASTGYEKSALFPTSNSDAFFYDGGYFAEPTLSHGIGYWLKFNSAQSVRQLGALRDRDTAEISAGWNLIGSIGYPILASSVEVSPSGNSLSSFFEYKGAYGLADTLKATQGYWVKADSDGYIVMAQDGGASKRSPGYSIDEFNTITISGKDGMAQTLYFGMDAEGKIDLRNFEIPPAAPSGNAVNARFVSGRILETYPAVVREGMEYEITYKSDNPLSVSWNMVNEKGYRFTLANESNGKRVSLTRSGTAPMKLSGEGKLVLKVEGGNALPESYSLGQNYPNPFNPTTRFRVALPQTGHVEISVFNILGQKVSTLVNEVRDAGYHTITWNGTGYDGSPAASGIYFVRMNADKFVSVQKVMLLK